METRVRAKKPDIAKIWAIIRRIFTWIIIVIAVGMMIFTIFSVTTFDRNNRSIFGFKFFIDLTDSMSPDYFSAGDIVITRNVSNPEEIKAGDVITYQSLMTGETYGKAITHKVREVKTNSEGNYGYVTYGTATGVNDELVVSYDFVLGKYVGKIPLLGYFFQYLKTPAGYIICILVPFLILIGLEQIKCIRIFKKYKREQLASMEAEKAKIESEHAESQRMMQEIAALKEMLAKQGISQTDIPTSEGTEKKE